MNRAQIKAQLQRQSAAALKKTQREAAAECARLSPQLRELEEDAPDTPALEQVRALFDEVCTRAQEADIEVDRRRRAAADKKAEPEPEQPAPEPPTTELWPPPWWLTASAVGAGALLLLGARSKKLSKQRAFVAQQYRKAKRKIRG